jgi:hypothetical protein
VGTSQSITVPSELELPDNAPRPSAENATEVTEDEWPSMVRTRRPVPTSQTLMACLALSLPPESTLRPSGENATEVTASE